MFTPRHVGPVCEMYSLTYFIALAIVLTLVIVGLILSKNFTEKQVRLAILIIGIFAVTTEIIKQIFLVTLYGWTEFEPIPMYFCSMLLYCPWFAISNNKHLRKIGTTFLTMGGILAAIAFFAYPNSCIPNYPIYHFMCLRTMLFHGSMIYVGLLILLTGYDKPKLKDYKYFAIVLGCACIISYIWNSICIATGFNVDANMMYIMKPFEIEFIVNLYNFAPWLYPFLAMIVECTIPYFISYGIYILVNKLIKKEV